MNTSTTPTAAPRTWRMFDWLIAALLLAILVYLIAPQQLPVSLYKLSLVALAAVAGYWIDRSTFPYARPHSFLASNDSVKTDPVLAAVLMLRRAIIMAAAMVAMGLGA